MWKKNDVLINKMSIPVTVTLRQTHLFKPSMVELPIYVRRPSLDDFLDTFDTNCTNDGVVEINIVFISDHKNITLSPYMDQPRSMLCRKLERSFLEDFADFDYIWLANFFRQKDT